MRTWSVGTGSDRTQIGSFCALTGRMPALRRMPSAAPVLARQALIVQLACLWLTAHPDWAGAVLGTVVPAQRAAAADISATADLATLTPPGFRPCGSPRGPDRGDAARRLPGQQKAYRQRGGRASGTTAAQRRRQAQPQAGAGIRDDQWGQTT